MRIYDWLSAVWRQKPRSESTFSTCGNCDIGCARGGLECLTCLRKRLTSSSKVTDNKVTELYIAIDKVLELEKEIISLVGEDTEL